MAILDTRRLKKEPQQNIDVIATQWDSFDRAIQGTRRWADGDPTFHIPGARVCVEFLRGRQWALEDIQARQREGRPIITLNRIKPIVQACRGYYRSNRYELKYLPGVDGTGQPAISTILSKLSKATDEANKSKWVDAHVFDDGITCGRGFWDTRLDFSKNTLGEIRERRLNPFMVHIDPEADEYDPQTWNEVTVEHWLTYDDLVATYGIRPAQKLKPLEGLTTRGNGVALMASSEDTDIQPVGYFGQFTSLYEGSNELRMSPGVGAGLAFSEHWNAVRRMFRVLDRQHYRRVRATRMVDPVTGGFRVLPHEWKEPDIRQAVEMMRARGIEVVIDQAVMRRVQWTVTCLDVVLFDEPSPYETFTTTPYFPDHQGGATRGLIHDLVDPQREVNSKRSAEMHYLNTSANPGWKWPEGSLSEEQKLNMRRNGAKPGFKLEYKNVGGAGPERIQPGAAPAAWDRLEQKASEDVEQLAGFNRSAMGQLDRVQSGRAIEARQRAAIAGLEPYFDSMALSKELQGRKRLEIYQNFYTEPRIITLTIQDRKEPEQIQINQQDAAGQIVNGISDGTFQATVDLVPISKSYEDGVYQDALELKKVDPQSIPTKTLIKLSSFPGKEEILTEMEEAAKNAPPPPEVLEQKNKQAEIQLKQTVAQQDHEFRMRELEIQAQKLELERMKIEGTLALGNRKIEADTTGKAADRVVKRDQGERKLDIEEGKVILGTLTEQVKLTAGGEADVANRAHQMEMLRQTQGHETRGRVLDTIVARKKHRDDLAHKSGEGDKNRSAKADETSLKTKAGVLSTLTRSLPRPGAKPNGATKH